MYSNSFGKRPEKSLKESKRGAKCTSSPSPIKRKRTTYVMAEDGCAVDMGSWTIIETAILETVESFICCTNFVQSIENISLLYKYVVQSQATKTIGLIVNTRTEKQISGKLIFEKKQRHKLEKLVRGADSIE